jgi:hypothetical protein
LDSEYGLGFTKDKSSFVQLLGAVVTLSKSKAVSSHHVILPSSSLNQLSSSLESSSKQQPSSLDSLPSFTIQQKPFSTDFNHFHSVREYFDITTLKAHQQNDSRFLLVLKYYICIASSWT